MFDLNGDGNVEYEEFERVSLLEYCRFGNIHEVLIFARRTNSRIQVSRENYYQNSATEEKIVNFKLHPKIEICENLSTRKLPDLQYYYFCFKS